MLLKIIIITTILIAIAVAGIAIKMFVKKDGEFQKSCGSVDPKTGERTACTCGDDKGENKCENKNASHEHH